MYGCDISSADSLMTGNGRGLQMIAGSNQPYLFPYIGSWQLINYVDVFVISDSMQYINKGYINRNNILLNGKKHLFTLEAVGAKSETVINDVRVGNNAKKLLSTFHHAYTRAPEFDQVFPMIEQVLLNPERSLGKFVGYSIQKVAQFLEMDTKFLYLSDLQGETNLKGQERTIDICKRVEADQFVNAIGGKELYDVDGFKREGIDLYFLRPEFIEYRQFNFDFVPSLSIIDILMFNSKASVKSMLTKFTLEQS